MLRHGGGSITVWKECFVAGTDMLLRADCRIDGEKENGGSTLGQRFTFQQYFNNLSQSISRSWNGPVLVQILTKT